MPHQHLNLKKKFNLSILNPKKKNNRIKIQKIHKFRFGFIFNKNRMNINPNFKYKNTPKFSNIFLPFGVNQTQKHKHTQTPATNGLKAVKNSIFELRLVLRKIKILLTIFLATKQIFQFHKKISRQPTKFLMSILRSKHFHKPNKSPYTQTQQILYHKPILSLFKFIKNPKEIQQTQPR